MKVINSQLIETTEFMGVYIHREFNLNFDSYSVETKRPNFVVFK